MNQKNLEQILSNYIKKFDDINNTQHNENYKWKIAKDFRFQMKEALKKDGLEFAEALYTIRGITDNLIDSFTQPFYGLVEFARKEPDTVKNMFLNLYADDGGDLIKQEEIIAEFFAKSKVLLDKYFPGSYRYKQNAHSVSAYLFLYDPDHHYMYKARQASKFADCIEYNESWGYGEHIDLKIFYKMCNQLLEEINKNDELIATDKSRFENRFEMKSKDMFSDQEKHMLIFDIIYCCSVYDLYKGISINKRKSKEKKLYKEQNKEALQFLKIYKNVYEKSELLKEAKTYFSSVFEVGTEIQHKVYGKGIVKTIDDKYISVFFSKQNKTKQLGLVVAVANGIVKSNIDGFDDKLKKYSAILKKADFIENTLLISRNNLKLYEEYLD